VGTYQDGTGYHGFVRDLLGNFRTINGPDTSYTTARGINDFGLIVGYYYIGNGWRGFSLSPNGTFTIIDVNPPGSTSYQTRITGLNVWGQIVGYTEGGTSYIGFLRDAGGQVTWIEVPTDTGPGGTQPYGINFWGRVAGSFNDVVGSHGFFTE
jgi:hypothetical protein